MQRDIKAHTGIYAWRHIYRYIQGERDRVAGGQGGGERGSQTESDTDTAIHTGTHIHTYIHTSSQTYR